MKKLGLAVSCLLFCFAPMVFPGQSEQSSQQGLTLQDYDLQIAQLKEDIARYKGLASMYDQQAQLVEFRDYDGFRDAAVLRDRCLDIVKGLKDHLSLLEKQKVALSDREANPQKKEL